MFKGIFWLKPDELISVKVLCDENGNELASCTFSSKSGKNFNHKIEWGRLPRSVTCGLKYDHYPRGRVEIGKGKAVLWLNPRLAEAESIDRIKKEFDLRDGSIDIYIKPDHSRHYECGKEP